MKRTGAVVLAAVTLLLVLNMSGSFKHFDTQQWRNLHTEFEEQEPTFRESERALWRHNLSPLKLCKNVTRRREQRPWGYVLVLCSNGPHYHKLQIAAAIAVAARLGATLILPVIQEAQQEPQSTFAQIYHVPSFISELQGVVRVIGRLPEEMKHTNWTVSAVPLVPSKKYVAAHIAAGFAEKAVVVLESFSMQEDTVEDEPEMEAVRCLVIYRALRFSSQVEKIGARLMERMREAGSADEGHFIAVDFRVGSNSNLSEVASRLQSAGFSSAAAIYVTQSPWHKSLQPLQKMFPNVHTKDYSLPFNEEKQYYLDGKTQLELALDLLVCSRSDVFIPTSRSLFAKTVVSQRLTAALTPFQDVLTLFKLKDSSLDNCHCI